MTPPPSASPPSTMDAPTLLIVNIHGCQDIEPDDARNKPHPDMVEKYKLVRRETLGAIANAKAWEYCRVIDKINDATILDDANAGSTIKDHTWCNYKEGHRWGICNCCGAKLKVKNSKWTGGSLNNHLETKHKIILKVTDIPSPTVGIHTDGTIAGNKHERNGDIKAMIEASEKKSESVQLKQKDALVRWVVDKNVPLSMVDDKSFRSMIHTYNSRAKFVSRREVRKAIIIYDHAIREVAMTLMKGQDVSITLDHWTSKGHDNYCGMTAHWIDGDFKLHSVPIGMFPYSGTSKAEAMLDHFKAHIEKAVGAGANIFAATTDTEAKMNSFGILLAELDIPHLYCTDHVLHCTCRKAYVTGNLTFQSEDEREAEAVQKVRSNVQFMNKSTQACESFLNVQRQIPYYRENGVRKLSQDVETRWWSTYLMMDNFIYTKSAHATMQVQNIIIGPHLHLTDTHWETVDAIHKILKPVMVAQKLLEGDKYVTCSWVPFCVHECRSAFEDNTHNINGAVRTMCETMLSNFETHWGTRGDPVWRPNVARAARNRQVGIHPFFIIAAFLDPRFKNLVGMGMDGEDGEQQKILIHHRILELMIEAMSATIHVAASSDDDGGGDDGDDGDDASNDNDDASNDNDIDPVLRLQQRIVTANNNNNTVRDNTTEQNTKRRRYA